MHQSMAPLSMITNNHMKLKGTVKLCHTWLLIIIIIIIIITSSDGIQPSTVVSDQSLCKSLYGYYIKLIDTERCTVKVLQTGA